MEPLAPVLCNEAPPTKSTVPRCTRCLVVSGLSFCLSFWRCPSLAVYVYMYFMCFMGHAVAPRPIEFYKRLAASGSRWMSLMDVSAPLQYYSPKVNFSAAYLKHVMDTLAPTVANATRLSIVDRMYVYGFG